MWRKNYWYIILIWNVIMFISYSGMYLIADDYYLTGIGTLWLIENLIFAYIIIAELLCKNSRKSLGYDADKSTNLSDVSYFFKLTVGFIEVKEVDNGNTR